MSSDDEDARVVPDDPDAELATKRCDFQALLAREGLGHRETSPRDIDNLDGRTELWLFHYAPKGQEADDGKVPEENASIDLALTKFFPYLRDRNELTDATYRRIQKRIEEEVVVVDRFGISLDLQSVRAQRGGSAARPEKEFRAVCGAAADDVWKGYEDMVFAMVEVMVKNGQAVKLVAWGGLMKHDNHGAVALAERLVEYFGDDVRWLGTLPHPEQILRRCHNMPLATMNSFDRSLEAVVHASAYCGAFKTCIFYDIHNKDKDTFARLSSWSRVCATVRIEQGVSPSFPSGAANLRFGKGRSSAEHSRLQRVTTQLRGQTQPRDMASTPFSAFAPGTGSWAAREERLERISAREFARLWHLTFDDDTRYTTCASAQCTFMCCRKRRSAVFPIHYFDPRRGEPVRPSRDHQFVEPSLVCRNAALRYGGEKRPPSRESPPIGWLHWRWCQQDWGVEGEESGEDS